ncbi:RNase adapter RapZ [Aquirhabdus parva]|uniref:RNase adapter RapZ n=1 Tax=Aquirhabdus parva TaxID=2283318 RepID=A0A345P8A4_9GAMM|nr:RNase adapter RapZ [Aquirhabdus parva]AXI03513.1 RNase adapter RapZ [Aquirhabdus parva]
MKKLLIVSGRSGAGKSSTLHMLEDLGYYCIDNLPVSLLPEIVAKLNAQKNIEMLALGVDVRTPQSDLMQFEDILEQLRQHGEIEVIFLNARDDVLLARYGATRRRHPLTDRYNTIAEALQAEDSLLSGIARHATLTLDTSNLNVHELQHTLSVKMGQNERMILILQSFGYKRGVPLDADFVFDVRHLPNPHWQPELRALTGMDLEVQEFLNGNADVTEMYNDILAFLLKWLPVFAASHRHYLTVAIGCTGGQHRSVYLVNRLADALKAQWPTQTLHRELKYWS